MPEQARTGVSPLIATVLLIAFSFALGAVVLTWGESFVEDRAQFVVDTQEVRPGCNGVDFELVELSGRSICKGASTFEFVVDNPGSPILSLQVKLLSAGSVQVIENVLPSPLLTGDTASITVPFTDQTVQQFRIVPTVLEGQGVYCPAEAKVLEGPFVSCS